MKPDLALQVKNMDRGRDIFGFDGGQSFNCALLGCDVV
jgi:hypothetical protein